MRYKCSKCRWISREKVDRCGKMYCDGQILDFPEPRIDGFVPDIAMVFSYKDSTYRCTLWYKRVPLSLPEKKGDDPEWYHEFAVDFFLKHHPEYWLEYKLVPCLREEATHVSGTSVAGCIARIEDIECDGTYVEWGQDLIDDQRSSAIHTATCESRRRSFMFDTYSDISWKYPKISEVFERFSFVKEEWEKAEDKEEIYLIYEQHRFSFCRDREKEQKTLDKGGELRIKAGEYKEKFPTVSHA